MDELWQPVTGYESFYEVSNLGRVRSHSRITTQLSKVGIPMTKTSKGKILRPITVTPAL